MGFRQKPWHRGLFRFWWLVFRGLGLVWLIQFLGGLFFFFKGVGLVWVIQVLGVSFF